MKSSDGYRPEMAAYGVTERLFALAAQPFIRPDDKSVCVYSDKFPIMGFVRHGH